MSMYTFTKADWNHVSGTHYVGSIVTTRRALERAFGAPDTIDADWLSDGKTTTEWSLLFTPDTIDDTAPVYVGTVYDWKRYELGAPEMDEVIEWHIGGHDDFVVRIIESLVVHHLSV